MFAQRITNTSRGSFKDYFSIVEFVEYAEARAVLKLKHSFVYFTLRGLNIEAGYFVDEIHMKNEVTKHT